MFCKECGRNIGKNKRCPYCRTMQESFPAYEFLDLNENKFYNYSTKTVFAAGILQLFLGVFGAGRFYLGYKRMAVLQLILSAFTLGMGGFVWGVVDGLMILNGREKYDASGRLLI